MSDLALRGFMFGYYRFSFFEGADVGAQEVDSVSALQRGEVADSPLHTLHVIGIGLAADVFYVIVL